MRRAALGNLTTIKVPRIDLSDRMALGVSERMAEQFKPLKLSASGVERAIENMRRSSAKLEIPSSVLQARRAIAVRPIAEELEGERRRRIAVTPRSASGADVAKVTEAVSAQTGAIIALHEAMTAQATRNEVQAEARAERADNRAAWSIWLLVAYALVDIFLLR